MILDTNVLSALAEGDVKAARKLEEVPYVAVPVVVLGEYRFGIARSRRRREYEEWLKELLALARVLVVSEETAVCYARLRVELKEAGTPIPSNDVWIAAICRQHGLPLLSRDRHFDQVKGLDRMEW